MLYCSRDTRAHTHTHTYALWFKLQTQVLIRVLPRVCTYRHRARETRNLRVNRTYTIGRGNGNENLRLTLLIVDDTEGRVTTHHDDARRWSLTTRLPSKYAPTLVKTTDTWDLSSHNQHSSIVEPPVVVVVVVEPPLRRLHTRSRDSSLRGESSHLSRSETELSHRRGERCEKDKKVPDFLIS